MNYKGFVANARHAVRDGVACPHLAYWIDDESLLIFAEQYSVYAREVLTFSLHRD